MPPPKIFCCLSLSLTILLTGCGGNIAVPVSDQSSLTARKPTYVVHSGDTLYSIAWISDRNPQDIAQWNGLDEPFVLHPGQELALFDTGRRNKRKTPKQVVATTRQNGKATNRQRTPRKSIMPPVDEWRWPVKGKLLRKFNPSGGNNGIDIAGEIGRAVHSAARGRVVYAGTGLRGYGRLVIVKHGDNFLSAYAHNQQVLVAEEESVRAGQQIATMGNSGATTPRLHFEIRQNGKPVDPMRFLPRNK